MSLCVDINYRAMERGFSEEGDYTPNRLHDEYQNNGIDLDDLAEIKSTLEGYNHAFQGAAFGSDYPEILRLQERLSEVFDSLDGALVDSEIVDDFKETVKATDDIHFDQQTSLIERLDSGQDVTNEHTFENTVSAAP